VRTLELLGNGLDLPASSDGRPSHVLIKYREIEAIMNNKRPLEHENFSADLLRGGEKIAEFLFGDPEHRRKVYHLAETSRLPVFRLGKQLCARRSTLLDWVARQERGGRASRPGTFAKTFQRPPAVVQHRAPPGWRKCMGTRWNDQ
jgi:hypothetical protein